MTYTISIYDKNAIINSCWWTLWNFGIKFYSIAQNKYNKTIALMSHGMSIIMMDTADQVRISIYLGSGDVGFIDFVLLSWLIRIMCNFCFALDVPLLTYAVNCQIIIFGTMKIAWLQQWNATVRISITNWTAIERYAVMVSVLGSCLDFVDGFSISPPSLRTEILVELAYAFHWPIS